MLILARKQGETILISEDVKVIVLEIDGNQVRLGFEAPRHITINRGEVLEANNQTTENK